MTIVEYARGAPLPPEKLCRLNSLQLAFIGDCIYDLFVRSHLMTHTDANVRSLQRLASAQVRASGQAQALGRVEGMLDQEEADVVRRGRNAHARSVPKNADPADYARATALEALVGYLYLAGREERLGAVMLRALCQEDAL